MAGKPGSTANPNNIRSDWNAADKMLSQFTDEQRELKEALIEDDYSRAIEIVCNAVRKFSGFTGLKSSKVRDELRAILDTINELEEYDSSAFDGVINRKTSLLDTRIQQVMEDLWRDINRFHFIWITSEQINKEDEDDVADNFERFSYNSLDPTRPKVIKELRDYWGFKYFDDTFKSILERQQWLAMNRKKDGLFIIGGYPGCGKSTLVHEIQDFYSWGNPNPERISWDSTTFSDGLNRWLNQDKIQERILHYDEANLDKRNSTTKWNKDITDLYLNIRAKQALHLWCNPSISMIDSRIRHERLTALIWIYNSTNPNKRFFSVIPARRLMEFEENFKNINRETLEKHGKKFSIAECWFTGYDNKPFLQQYEEKKNSRMDAKVDQVIKRHGTQENGDVTYFNLINSCKYLKVGTVVFQKAVKDALNDGYFKEEDITNAAGKYRLTQDHLEKLKEHMRVWRGKSESANDTGVRTVYNVRMPEPIRGGEVDQSGSGEGDSESDASGDPGDDAGDDGDDDSLSQGSD